MKAASLILSCLLFLNAPYAYSHGGGLNSDGCHNTSSGGYHCHGVGSSSGGGGSEEDELSGGQIALYTIGTIGILALMIWAKMTAERPYALNEEEGQDSLAHDKEEADKQDSFSVSTTPLLIPQGGGLSLELSF